MSEALATDAPAQAAAIATEEVQHPVEDGDTTMSSTKAEPDLASYVKGSEVEPAGEVKAELKPTVKLVIEKPAVKDRSAEEVDELLAKAAKQVCFYFSDSNLPIDRYFFSLTACNKEGWVPIRTILTFKRMREFEEFGAPFVAYALQQAAEAEGSDPLIALSEDGTNVKRQRPLEPNTTAWKRSIYVKGFGEGDSDETSQEKLEAYFAQFGKINAVRKRRVDLEGKGPKGKGKGKFKGSCFAEFAYETEMKKFLEMNSVPKYTSDGPNMLVMSKDAYVNMKAKEKGIDQKTLHRGSPSTDRSTPAPSENGANSTSKFSQNSNKKFNAFREMDKLRKGGIPQLAKIPDTVAVIGKPLNFYDERSKKRERDDDERERPAKAVKPEHFKIEYNGAKLQCDRETGQVTDKHQIPFEKDAVIKFVGAGPNADWKDLKIQITKNGVEKPFLACPPGSQSGSLAKTDSTLITDAEMANLQDAKMLYGGVEVEWQRMSEDEQRDFWHTRANFQGKIALAALNEKISQPSKMSNGHAGNRAGPRGGRGARGGQRGGGKGGGRGGRGGKESKQNGRGTKTENGGMPPTVGTGPVGAE